jgi:hypothetical protein
MYKIRLFPFVFIYFVVLVITISSCISLGPIAAPPELDIKSLKIGIVSTIENKPIIVYRGLTIFENTQTPIHDFNFDFHNHILTETSLILNEKGYNSTPIKNESLENILREKHAYAKEINQSDLRYFQHEGYDVIMLIQQSMIREGLRTEAGPWIDNHGLWQLHALGVKRDYLVMPFRVALINVNTGDLIARPRFRDNDDNIKQLDFINGKKAVIGFDEDEKQMLYQEYINKYRQDILIALNEMGFE